MNKRQQNKAMNQAMSRIKDSSSIGQGYRDEVSLLVQFGCHICQFAGTKTCPHKIAYGKKHANGICNFKTNYLKEEFKKCKSMVRLVQVEELFNLKQMSNRLTYKFAEEGEVPDEFKDISKLLISLSDKMRRQDEGIKINVEGMKEQEDFRKLIDAEAKRIEERNNKTRPAEFTEEVPTS